MRVETAMEGMRNEQQDDENGAVIVVVVSWD